VVFGSHELPSVGDCPFWIVSPVAGSMSCAYPATSPSVPRTPSTERTSPSTRSGIGLRSSVGPPEPSATPALNAVCAWTTTSVPA
jgi:hypothetical protein